MIYELRARNLTVATDVVVPVRYKELVLDAHYRLYLLVEGSLRLCASPSAYEGYVSVWELRFLEQAGRIQARGAPRRQGGREGSDRRKNGGGGEECRRIARLQAPHERVDVLHRPHTEHCAACDPDCGEHRDAAHHNTNDARTAG